MGDSWLKFELQLPKNMMLEITGKHFSGSEHISWQNIGIWPTLMTHK